MTVRERNEAIAQKFRDRADQRREAFDAEVRAETEEVIASSPVESRMPVGEALEFFGAGGEREDIA